MEIKNFYKELYSKLNDILKPFGFRKKGDRFRCFLDNGIIWEVEIQRNEFKIAKLFSCTVNIYIGLVPTQKPMDIWEKETLQISGNLGEEMNGHWDKQKWYDLSVMINPQVKVQIRDNMRPLQYQEPGKEMQTMWLPVQTFDEIIDEVCDLVEHKVIPFYQTVQTFDGYMELLKTGSEKGFMISKSNDAVRLYADIFRAVFLPVLNEWLETSYKSLAYLLSQDMSQYDDFYIQSHEKLIATRKEQIAFMKEIAEQLQE